MADITQIKAYVYTADEAHASAEGNVYLGIAGREFLLRKQGQDTTHQQGEKYTYVLGQDSNVADARYNDPTTPPLDTDDLDHYPVYLRLEPSGLEPAWCLEWVDVTVNPDTKVPHVFANPRLKGTDPKHRLWLDTSHGTTLYLKRSDDNL
ncbi:hypothetical protein ABT382_36295 [Streptomyces pharetrae]|uniref:hypothetical protein n=1 Tax=Streptomyces pharetrae TaxID=291370 RepID=UPI0033575C17